MNVIMFVVCRMDPETMRGYHWDDFRRRPAARHPPPAADRNNSWSSRGQFARWPTRKKDILYKNNDIDYLFD